MSAPLQSTATTGVADCRASMSEVLDSGPGAAAPLLVVLVLVVAAVRGWGDDLTPGVEAALRAHAVRPTRTVALRTGVHRGRADLVLCAPLGGSAVRLLFLGDGH
jgi:hypothetical protein